ncbi:MAG: glycosyltransferase family 4 protein [Ruminococcaceae bacterium]|nr:glycosyltransferase family 4 protein [Oscillospiraceae bacterium]
MENKLPRVLVLSINVWQDKGLVRTLPEIFSCWDRERVAQIYTKAGLPDTQVCHRFFRINENAVMKSIFKRSTVTSSVVENTKSDSPEQEREVQQEQKRYNGRHSVLLSLMREMVWLLGKWKTPELLKFIEDFDPELLFVPVYPVVYMARIQNYIIKKTKKPVVCYLSDDNYSYKTCGWNPLSYIHRFWLRCGVKKLMKNCHRLFVIAPKQKEEYDRIFRTDSLILTRAIDTDALPKQEKKPHTPIRMVYTGKLCIGRDKTVSEVAKAVANINKDSERICFEVYSGDTPKGKLKELLSTGGNRFCGSVTADKVEEIQKNSDITLFAEALKGRYKNAARLSFSTKLTDYFKSGACVFAVGPEDIAPVDYLIREDAAVVVTDYRDIEDKLRNLCDNPALITEYGRKAVDCGVRNHNRDKVVSTFIHAMCNCTERD